ncbi:Glu-tRNA(Gln) amidotransferase subunit GatD [Candidatus Pacearchaeota archaeon]|nr:Glu-tRNA(Gln) amidotransferase subunit GatD [Candidatus Pacearchaeota archaeon]
MEPETGDKIKITTAKETIEGTLLESYQPEIILIKLKSGYNIGIKKEDIINIAQIEKKKPAPEKKAREIKPDKNLPKIDIIMTGGTISSRLDSKTGGVSWLTSADDFFKFYPELFDIVNIRKIIIPFMKASENMDAKDWQEIAKETEKSLNDSEISGVIITHGTDFLHYTSAALSFFLKDINKPVVLTYSQRSSDRASSDASLNLQCAARAAISEIAEVMLVGHSSTNDNFCFALKGNKVRKMHSSRRDAFKPVNSMPIAKIYPDRIEPLTSYNKRDNNKKVKLDSNFNEKIALVKFYPGMNPEIFDYLSQKYEGIVIEASGLGHLAIDEARKNLLPAIKKAIDNGLIVCITSQTLYGRVNPYVYSPGRKLMKSGIIFLEDTLPETAYVKLGYVLGHKNWKSQIKEKMQENLSGEINQRLEE